MKTSAKRIGVVGYFFFRKVSPERRLLGAVIKRSRQAGRVYIAYRVARRVLRQSPPRSYTVKGEHVVIDVS